MSEHSPEDSIDDAPKAGSGNQLELVRSYLAFAWRAIRPRWTWVMLVLVVGLGELSQAARASVRGRTLRASR